MSDFSPGDIMVVNFPYREDPTRFSKRPAMIISKKDDNHYMMSQITRTNRVGEIKGEWIDQNSDELEEMGLDEPSFINLENILPVPKSLIIYGPIGKYPDVEKLLKLYNLCFQTTPPSSI
jgi:hypothetical protein